MHRVSPHRVVFDTCCINEFGIKFLGQKRIRELSEKLFQQTGNTIDVVLKGLRVTEINLSGVYIMLAVDSTFRIGRHTTVK